MLVTVNSRQPQGIEFTVSLTLGPDFPVTGNHIYLTITRATNPGKHTLSGVRIYTFAIAVGNYDKRLFDQISSFLLLLRNAGP